MSEKYQGVRAMAELRGSVGKGGKNFYNDVFIIQRLLLSKGITPGPLDGICGPRTISAIVSFQSSFLSPPDGLIEPDKITWRKLAVKVHKENWSGNSARWSQQKKLSSLNPHFRSKVKILLQKLKNRGFQPKIFYGWRSVAAQQQLFKRGVTRVRFSFHNAQTPAGGPNSYAADIIDSRYAWSNTRMTHQYWSAQGEEAKKLGLYWGGDWRSPWDPAHVQFFPNSKLSAVKKESGL
jgi:hypothetical protein